MVDGWMGDDCSTTGPSVSSMSADLRSSRHAQRGRKVVAEGHNDEYDMFMQAGSAGELGRRRGLDQLGFWKKLVEHPAYDAFWRDQPLTSCWQAAAKTPVIAGPQPLDQEDIYGAPAVYKAIKNH